MAIYSNQTATENPQNTTLVTLLSIRGYLPASSRRTISAPAAKALSLPRAIWRGNGAMPQLVHG